MSDFDPDAFLSGTSKDETVEPAGKTTGFDPDAFLSSGADTSTAKYPEETKKELDVGNAIATAAPAAFSSQVRPVAQPIQMTPAGVGLPNPATYEMAPTGYSAKGIGQAIKPVVTAAGNYLKNPLNPIADVALAHMGMPPVAGAKSLYDTYQGAKDALNATTKVSSKFDEANSLNKFYNPLKDAVSAEHPEMLKPIQDAFKTGGPQAVKNLLNSKQGQQILNNPATRDAAQAFMGAVPGMGAQAMRVVGPVLRGAGRILGPAGLAMNAYDAGQMAGQTQLGQRLAGGQGQIAQAAFRNVQATAGAQYQLQPHEAANVLASGDPATINLYGGPQRLQAIAGGQSPSAPPTSTNFIERMKAMAHQYGMIGNQQ